MSKTFKLFNKKNFGKMDLRASKKKRQRCQGFCDDSIIKKCDEGRVR